MAARTSDGPALSALLALAVGAVLIVIVPSGGHPFLIGPAMALGLAVLLVAGTIQAIRRRVGPAALIWGLAAWVLPWSLPLGGASLGRWLVPREAGGLNDISLILGLGMGGLYGLGAVLARAARESSAFHVAFTFTALPSIAGLVLAGLILQQAFTSLTWRNRRIVAEITSTRWSGDGLVVDGFLDTSRGDPADVRAADDLGAACHVTTPPNRSYLLNARIEWLDRALRHPIEPGRYRVRLTWPELPAEATREGVVEIRLDLTRASEWGGRDSLREFRFRIPRPSG